MVTDRRQFVVSAATVLAATLLPLPASGMTDGATRFITSARRGEARYVVLIVNERGEIEREFALSGRGHDIAQSPDGSTVVAFARRPGTFAVVIDLAGARPPHVITARPDRHFYGHGVFSPDGRLLYATENDFDTARGVLGVYDVAAGYARIGEIETGGIGPHDVLLMPDGITLCVANGGIETHPSAGRAKLNLDSMRASLVFIDRASGDLKARHELPQAIHHLSIRHLAVDAAGAVWFGGQWEGAVHQSPWLIGRASADRAIAFVEAGAVEGPGLKGYIGSMSANGDRSLIVASSPRAGRVIHIDAANATVVAETALHDVSGIAPARGRQMAWSSGSGRFEVGVPSRAVSLSATVADIAFDNHMRRLR